MSKLELKPRPTRPPRGSHHLPYCPLREPSVQGSFPSSSPYLGVLSLNEALLTTKVNDAQMPGKTNSILKGQCETLCIKREEGIVLDSSPSIPHFSHRDTADGLTLIPYPIMISGLKEKVFLTQCWASLPLSLLAGLEEGCLFVDSDLLPTWVVCWRRGPQL